MEKEGLEEGGGRLEVVVVVVDVEGNEEDEEEEEEEEGILGFEVVPNPKDDIVSAVFVFPILLNLAKKLSVDSIGACCCCCAACVAVTEEFAVDAGVVANPRYAAAAKSPEPTGGENAEYADMSVAGTGGGGCC